MSVLYTEEEVINVMFNLRIGTVTRVDFVNIGQKPGFKEIIDDNYKAAFVHLYLPRDETSKHKHNHNHVYPRNQDILDMIDADEPCRIQVSPNEYWVILRNKNPVPQTMMNIHQVVENGRHLENVILKQNKKLEEQSQKLEEQSQKLEEQSQKLEEQSQKLEEQDATIKKLESKLDGIHTVVYQLIGGLFNQGNQRDILGEHSKCLFPETSQEYTCDALPEKNKWTIYPTTRQGDECERRVEALEQTVRDMLNFDFPEPQEHYDEAELLHRCNVNYIEPEEHYEERYEEDYEKEAELLHRCNVNYIHNDNASTTTYSSMPELIDNDNESFTTYSSMPELIDDVNSLDSGERIRIRNSCELCGNE
jgi:hypothetical protein